MRQSWEFNQKTKELHFSNGSTLERDQILSLIGNLSPEEMKEDFLADMPEHWDENQVDEFYEFMLEHII